MRRLIIAALALLAGAFPSYGQTPFVRTQPTVTLAATNVSSNVALGTDLSRVSTLWTCNKGPSDANVFFGDSTVVATATGTLIPAGMCVTVSPDGKTYLAAITASGTAALSITPGNGTMAAAGSPGGGSTTATSQTNVSLTDCSGTVTLGGAANNAFTAQTTLHGFTIANIDTSEVLWFSPTGTAVASGTGSYPLAPATATTFAGLASFTSPAGMGTNHALSVIAATTAHKFSCTWW